MAAENRVGTKPGVGHGLGHGIPANSQALCVSLTPADLKLWPHAFRLISHA